MHSSHLGNYCSWLLSFFLKFSLQVLLATHCRRAGVINIGTLADAETTTEIDDDITLADGKRTLTNSQLLILGFIASYGVAGCSESKRDIAEALQVSLKTVDRAILRLRKEGFIISVARYAENGMRLSNTYHVPTPEVKGEQLHAIAG